MLLERPCLYHSSGYNMRCSYSEMSLCLSAGSLRTRITPCCPPPAPSHRTWHSVVRKRHSFIYTWQARNSWAGSWVCAHICVCVCVCMCVYTYACVNMLFLPLLIRRANPEENKGLRVCCLYRPILLFSHIP